MPSGVHAAGSPRRRDLVLRGLGCALGVTTMTTLPAGCAQAIYGDPKEPVAGRVLDTTVHTRDTEELRFVALRMLTDRFAAEQGITVTPEEVEAYQRSVRAALAQDLARARTHREELTARLAAAASQPAERERLGRELEQARQAVDALEGIGAGKPPDPADAQARAEIATAFVRQWKINGALWRHYGGRIGYQQGGPEPLDAHRALLEQAQSRGELKIVDPALEATFWSYYRDDRRHSFYPRGSAEEARAFTTPPWLTRAP